MENISEVQTAMIADFAKFNNWEERYKKIIALGKNLEPYPEEQRTEDKLVNGCQSQVWLFAEYKEGRVVYYGDSDAMIVKGLLSLILRIFSGQKAIDIIQFTPSFLTEIGLNVHLSQSRSNGLAAMIKQIKLYAMAFMAIHESKE